MPYIAPLVTPGRRHTATIASGVSLSAAVTLPLTHTLVGLVMPAAWDTADLSFQGSFDGTTYGALCTVLDKLAPTGDAIGEAIFSSDPLEDIDRGQW